MALRVGILTERMILGFGVDLVVHELASRLAARGGAVTVFTTRTDDIYARAPYPIVDLTRHVSGGADVFSAAFMVDAVGFLRTQAIDAWVVETPPFYYWLEHLPPPVVCVEHGTPPGSFFPRSTGRKLDRSTRRRYEGIYGRLRPGDALVAISEYIRSCFPERLRKVAAVIHNGGDHYPPATAEASAAFRRRLGIGDANLVVLWVGRAELDNDVQPYKGFQELLRLAPRIKAALPKAQIVVVGRGDEAARRAMEAAGITVALNLARDEMPAAFRAADVFLSTSRWEGFNLPLVEAQHQGTPVVAYDLCAHPEVVLDGTSGLLAGNADGLLDAVVRIAEDAGYRRHLAAGARASAARFTWDSNAEALAAVLERCVREARAHAAEPKLVRPVRKDLRYYISVVVQIMLQEGPVVLLRESLSALRKRLRRLLSSTR